MPRAQLRIFRRVAACALLSGVILATVSPLAQPASDTWLAYAVFKFGRAVWTSQVLILAAILTLSVRSQLLAFPLVLLTAFIQAYAYVGLSAYWSGTVASDFSDDQIRFAVILGLSAALSAVLWVLYRMFRRMALSDEAAHATVGNRQIGLSELACVTVFLSAIFAGATWFSTPRVIPAEQMLFVTVEFTADNVPCLFLPFWLTAFHRVISWHWLWVLPLAVLYVAFTVWSQYSGSFYFGTAAFVGIVLGNALTVAVSGVAVHALGLTWRQWVPDLVPPASANPRG